MARFTTDGAPYYNYRLNRNGKLKWFGKQEKAYSTDRLARIIDRLISRWADEPWFVYYAPFAPHTPRQPAARHRDRLTDLPPHRPPSYLGSLKGKPRWLAKERGSVWAIKGEPANTDRRRIRQLQTLLAVDEAVAALSDRIEALGLTENTLVVFTSDNGQAWLEHWLRFKNYPYEEAIRVPLVVRYPKRVHVPRRVEELVQPIDFYPTFAELAGVAGQPGLGRSLLPFLEGREVDWRDDILLEHFSGAGIDPSIGVRTKRWKLIETDARKGGVTPELYDLENDPYEQHNLAAAPEHADRVERLRERARELAGQ